MATATVLSDKQLEADLDQELQRFETVQKKLDQDTHKLQTARAERTRIVAAIPHGRADESEVPKIEAEIHRFEVLVEGNAPILTQHRARIDELRTEIHRRQTEADKAQHEKQFAEHEGKMIALALAIREKLTRLVTEDLREFEELRGACMTNFPDLGGRDAATKALKILFDPPRPSERLRPPEVHLARLDAAGWVPFGVATVDRPVSQGGGFRVVPGAPLNLTVVSMRPKTLGS